MDGEGDDVDPSAALVLDSAIDSTSMIGGGGASPAFASACPTTVFTGLFRRGLCFLASGEEVSTNVPSVTSRILGLAGDSNSALVLAGDSKSSQMAASFVVAVLAAAAAGEVGRQKESLEGKGAIGAVVVAAKVASCGGF